MWESAEFKLVKTSNRKKMVDKNQDNEITKWNSAGNSVFHWEKSETILYDVNCARDISVDRI